MGACLVNQNAADQAALAIKSPWLADAYEQYLMAYRQDLDCYYPGLNALALAVIIIELAARFPRFGIPVWATIPRLHKR